MTDKLEIMQWLYKQGIEPRMWYQASPFMPGGYKLSPVSSKGTNAYDMQIESPYHPLEQVLEELDKHRDQAISWVMEPPYHLTALRTLKKTMEERQDG